MAAMTANRTVLTTSLQQENAHSLRGPKLALEPRRALDDASASYCGRRAIPAEMADPDVRGRGPRVMNDPGNSGGYLPQSRFNSAVFRVSNGRHSPQPAVLVTGSYAWPYQ